MPDLSRSTPFGSPAIQKYVGNIYLMTRHADIGTRRTQIAEALVSTVAERGLGRTTLADIAMTAGVSVGLVQRYFRNKDELLWFGVEYIYQRAVERMQQVEITPPVRQIVIRIIETFLPLDPERERELKVWLAFVHASLTDQKMAAIHKTATTGMIDGITEALQGAQRSGELAAGLDAASESAALVAFVDGLSLHHTATGAGYEVERLRAAVRVYVDRLFSEGTTA